MTRGEAFIAAFQSKSTLFLIGNSINISVDQFLFPDTGTEKFMRRRQHGATLDALSEKDYIAMQSTTNGLKEAKGE